MTRWNPNDPAVLGPEFLGVQSGSVLPTLASQLIQRFRSNSAETIVGVRLHRATAVGNGAATYIAEVTAAGAEVDDGLYTTTTFAPNVLTNTSGSVTDGSGGAALVTAIDEWPPIYTDKVAMGSSARMDLEFATAGLASTGRITSVAVEVVQWRGSSEDIVTGGADSSRRITVSLINASTSYGAIEKVIPNNNKQNTAGRSIYSWGEINPITGLPWTNADLTALDTATTRIRLHHNDSASAVIATVRLIVTYENTERRVAQGALAVSGTVAAEWTGNIALSTPAGVANWSKANATDYALVVRRADLGDLQPTTPDSLVVSTVLAAAGSTNPADLGSYTATGVSKTVLTDNSVSLAAYFPTSEAEVVGRLAAFVLRLASSTSADGQPYSTVERILVHSGSGDSFGEFRTSTTEDYNSLRLAIGRVAPTTQTPNDTMNVNVRRRSDNFLEAFWSIQGADIPVVGAGEPLAVHQLRRADFTLTSGVQYYLDFDAGVTPLAEAFIIGLLAVNAAGGGVLYDEATYGGATDVADPIAGSAATALSTTPGDFAALVEEAVEQPTDVAAVGATSQPAQLMAGMDDPRFIRDTLCKPGPVCVLAGVPYVELSWTPPSPALGADFAYYTIQRVHWTGDSSNETIAIITDEAVSVFYDYEAAIGVDEWYRMAVTNTAGVQSNWTTYVIAANGAPSPGTGLVFTSNELPERGVVFPDVYPDKVSRDFDFPESSESKLLTMYGRDHFVAFAPLSRRGVTFQRTLAIESGPATLFADPSNFPTLTGVGPIAVDAIRELARSSLSYVCVRDEVGNRWFGHLQVLSLSVRPPSIHLAQIQFTETTAIPSTPNSVAT